MNYLWIMPAGELVLLQIPILNELDAIALFTKRRRDPSIVIAPGEALLDLPAQL